MELQFVAKKVDGQYEAALIVDRKFKRALSDGNPVTAFVRLVGPALLAQQEDGAEIAINVTILTAAEANMEAKINVQPRTVL